MTSLKGSTDMAKLKELSKKRYGFQAKWFLNAFWEEGPAFGKEEKKCEEVWTFAQNMTKLDKNGKEGNELEEFTAHRFLEKNTEALTWTDMRNALKELDIDFDKKVSLTEFLVHHYKVDWKALVNATQGSNKLIVAAEKAVAEAQAKRDICVKKLEIAAADEEKAEKAADDAHAAAEEARAAAEKAREAAEEARKTAIAAKDAAEIATRDADLAHKAAEEAQRAEESAKKAEELAKEKEEASKAAAMLAQKASDAAKAAHDVQLEAEAEVKTILDRIKGYQNALKKRGDALQAIIDDPSVGTVKKMKAKHELMDLKNGSRARRKGMDECNPELLNKAKIDQKAAVRKQKKVTKEAKAKADEASEAANNAEAAANVAEKSREEAEEAARASVEKRQDAENTKINALKTKEEAEKTHADAEAAQKDAEAKKEESEAKSEESEAKRAAAVETKEEASRTKAAAEVSVKESEKAMEAAQEAFKKAKSSAKGGEGTLWWMGRDLEEQKKYLPRAAFNRLARKHAKKVAAVRKATKIDA